MKIVDKFGQVQKIEPPVLEYIEINDFYSCPHCGFEVWMSVDKHRGKQIKTWEAQAAYRDERRRQQAMRPKKSASRSAGRKSKEPPKYYPYNAWHGRIPDPGEV